jgi:hypothetical protein
MNETDIAPHFPISSSAQEKILSNFDPECGDASLYGMMLESEQPDLMEGEFVDWDRSWEIAEGETLRL